MLQRKTEKQREIQEAKGNKKRQNEKQKDEENDRNKKKASERTRRRDEEKKCANLLVRIEISVSWWGFCIALFILCRSVSEKCAAVSVGFL